MQTIQPKKSKALTENNDKSEESDSEPFRAVRKELMRFLAETDQR